MTHLRCCDNPANLREVECVGEGPGPRPRRVLHAFQATIPIQVQLVCIGCGQTLATSDERGELFADY